MVKGRGSIRGAVAGIGVLATGRLRLPHGAAPFLLLFPSLYFAYSLTAHINIGQRHLLPMLAEYVHEMTIRYGMQPRA